MKQILSNFSIQGAPDSVAPYGNGHINETYRVDCEGGNAYILQKINTSIFRRPDLLMQNIRLVTDHLAKRCSSRREVLTLVPTVSGETYAALPSGCWRVYEFVKDSACLERAETPAQFAESATAFGRFFNQLANFDATLLTETIPHFHDTPARFRALQKAIAEDTAGRVKTAGPEIEAALSHAAFVPTFAALQAAGELPLRVTHNDTKINNVLFDRATMRGLCVIDLDTVMPGLIMNDFGDSIRFGASTAAEDEPDLSRVTVDLALYEAYLRAYLAVCGGALTPLEVELLPVGAKMMTYECGIRFLTDYLSGDAYFHIRFPEQNLYRARTQLKLVSEMDRKWAEMEQIRKGAAKQ